MQFPTATDTTNHHTKSTNHQLANVPPTTNKYPTSIQREPTQQKLSIPTRRTYPPDWDERSAGITEGCLYVFGQSCSATCPSPFDGRGLRIRVTLNWGLGVVPVREFILVIR